jgi:hypothetical protein
MPLSVDRAAEPGRWVAGAIPVSVITVVVDASADIPTAVRTIRPITGWGVTAIRHAVENGTPVFERELFGNDFAEVAGTLRSLVAGLREVDVPFVIREDGHPITPAVLNNILQGAGRYRL